MVQMNSHLIYSDKINLLNYILKNFGMNQWASKYCYFNNNWKLVSIFDKEVLRLGINNGTTIDIDENSIKEFKTKYPNYKTLEAKIITIGVDGKIILRSPMTIDEVLDETMNEMTALDIVKCMEFVLQSH